MTLIRKLMLVVLLSGTGAGLLLFGLQHKMVFPLIQEAEKYEDAARPHLPEMDHSEHDWEPAEGLERTVYTAITTVLTGIGFSALLFGSAALQPMLLNWRKGALLGAAGFVCVHLVPSLGLPPQLPGTPTADLSERQLWWLAAIACTAAGLWLLTRASQPGIVRSLGALVILLPHIWGAPVASGPALVPASLVSRFVFFSLLTAGIFWLSVGALGGFLYAHFGYAETGRRT